jgi:hypothetical protein
LIAIKRSARTERDLRRLTIPLGRTAAFIISMSAVPPAIGRTDASSGSSSATACSATAARQVRIASCMILGRRLLERGLQFLGELQFHLLGLCPQHGLPDTAQLPG